MDANVSDTLGELKRPKLTGLFDTVMDSEDCINLSESVHDSPIFRVNLAKAEIIAAQLRANYAVTVESCRRVTRTGEAFASALTNLAQSLNMNLLPKPVLDPTNGFNLYNRCPTSTPPSLMKLPDECGQVNHLLHRFATLTSDLASQFDEPINRILTMAQQRLDQLNELRGQYHKSSDQLNQFVHRMASLNVNRSTQSSLLENDSQTQRIRNSCHTTTIAYLSALYAAIRQTPMVAYLRTNIIALSAEYEYSKRLNALFNSTSSQQDLQHSGAKDLQTKLNNLLIRTETNLRLFDEDILHQTIKSSELLRKNTKPQSRLEGYLFKRTNKRSWRAWSRRWFKLCDNQLVYCKQMSNLSSAELELVTQRASFALEAFCKSKEVVSSNGVGSQTSDLFIELDKLKPVHDYPTPKWKLVESDLRLCTARMYTQSDRRFTFELISPEHRIHLLQAESEESRGQWMETLQSGLLHFERNLCASDPHKTPESISTSSYSTSTTTYTRPSEQTSNSNLIATTSLSTQSTSDYQNLRTQGGIILWREPYGIHNRLCADCLVEGGASWASTNFGVTLCTNCAAVHRSLGVRVSRIRSLTLDNWEPELVHLMLNLGNEIVNQIYEANLSHSNPKRPCQNSSAEIRRHWIHAKWSKCEFVKPYPSDDQMEQFISWVCGIYKNWSVLRRQLLQTNSSAQSAGCASSDRSKSRSNIQDAARANIIDEMCNLLRQPSTDQSERQLRAASIILCSGARFGCLPLMLTGFALGASPDGVCELVHSKSAVYPPLIWAVRSGSLAATEFLLVHGADLNIQDESGRTALHHACELGRVHVVCLLIRRRANSNLRSLDGQLPLDVAVKVRNADIVTLLRLQRLHNDEDNGSDAMLMDETVTDVFRDYTSRAYFVESDEELSDRTLVVDHNPIENDPPSSRNSQVEERVDPANARQDNSGLHPPSYPSSPVSFCSRKQRPPGSPIQMVIDRRNRSAISRSSSLGRTKLK